MLTSIYINLPVLPEQLGVVRLCFALELVDLCLIPPLRRPAAPSHKPNTLRRRDAAATRQRRGGDTVGAALRSRGSTAVSSTCCRVVVICLTTSAWYFVCQPCTPHGYRYGTTAAPEAAPEAAPKVAPKVAPFTAQHDGQLYAADGCKRGHRAWIDLRPHELALYRS